MKKSKTCFKCGEIKPLSSFYKHKGMADGYLGKCKICAQKDTKEHTDKLVKDYDWHEKEKARQREKYYRLDYKEKHKPTTDQKRIIMKRYKDKYPEKLAAKNKSQHLKPVMKGNHMHHWSYKEEHWKAVIELTPKDHAKIHRFMIYDQERMMYRKASDLTLLDTLSSHLSFIWSITGIPF